MKRSEPRGLTLPAYAKINLTLRVGPKRRDGYHTIDTVFQEISLCDTLQFQPTEDGKITLTCDRKFIPTNSKNIVVRALTRLKDHLQTNEGMRINLRKRIPMGAGLGGGSSDAACALRAGWNIWTKKRPDLRRKGAHSILPKLAASLGADVPFFLKGGRARGRGIGEKLAHRRGYKKDWWILIQPPVHVSTKKAYELLDKARARKKSASLGKKSGNDFEEVIFKHEPLVKVAFDRLQKAGCREVRMSGSGAVVYGKVSSKKTAQRIKKIIESQQMKVFIAQSR